MYRFFAYKKNAKKSNHPTTWRNKKKHTRVFNKVKSTFLHKEKWNYFFLLKWKQNYFYPLSFFCVHNYLVFLFRRYILFVLLNKKKTNFFPPSVFNNNPPCILCKKAKLCNIGYDLFCNIGYNFISYIQVIKKKTREKNILLTCVWARTKLSWLFAYSFLYIYFNILFVRYL